MSKIRLCIPKEPLSFPAVEEFDPSLEKWDDHAGNVYGFGLPRGTRYWMKFYHFGCFVAEPGYAEVLGSANRGVDLGRFQEMFLRFVLPWVMQRQQWDCLHASAVLTAAGVVAFCGPTGRGKSTLARACCERGALPYSDDAVPFLIRDGVVLSARIPQPLRPREPAASRFAAVPKPEPNGGSELVWDLEPSLRPLSAVYWLEPAPDGHRPALAVIERLPAAEGFRSMLSEAHCMTLRDAACNRKMIRNYLSLAQLTPVFRLSFASDLDLIPQVLDCLEENQQRLSPA